MTDKETTEEEWVEELFYFGNANWPSDATYRSKGDRRQLRVEMGLQLEPSEKRESVYNASPEKVAEFLQTYQDCQIRVHDSYAIGESYGGGRQAPSLYVLGWYELTTEDDHARYEEDKRIGG